MSLKARRIRRAAARRGNGGQPTRPRATVLDRLRGAQVHQWIAELEPWSILLALVGFAVAFYQFYDERTALARELAARQGDRDAYRAELERQNEIAVAGEADNEQDRINVALASLAGGYGRRDDIDTLVRNAVDLRNLQAPNAVLPEADLSDCGGDRCNLSGANLARVIFSDAQLEGADLSAAQMQHADFLRARMPGADLHRTRMEGALLAGAQLHGAIFARAQLDAANFNTAQMGRVNLGGARLEGAVFTGAFLNGSSFSHAWMQGAFLTQASMRFVSWAGANLRGAQAHDTNFSGGEGPTQEQLDGMIGNEGTILPPGRRIASCWPEGAEEIAISIAALAFYNFTEDDYRENGWICPEGEDPEYFTGPLVIPAE
ncbi:MAG: pentapeptide repeat-containing protein [Pseudomonadota bacterium]